MNTTFVHWLRTFVGEKGLDRDTVFEVEGPEWGTNFIPLEIVLRAIENAPANEQTGIKNMIVRIDFANGDVMGYFKHLAQALAL